MVSLPRADSPAGFARALLPDHARLQFAGGQGLVSAGPGWGWVRERIQADILYGWVPASVAGRSVHAVSQKTTVAPLVFSAGPRARLAPLLAGWSANVALGENYHLILPNHHRNYYWPSALHFWFFAGTRARAALGSGPGAGAVSAVAEVGAHDVYWRAWLRNETLGLPDILSLSLSVQLHFGN